MGRYIARTALGLVLAAVVLYLGDLGVWHVRGGPLGSATVSKFQVAPLKGNKEEYYFDGTAQVDCSQTIFPQAGDGACWWVRRHPVVFYH